MLDDLHVTHMLTQKFGLKFSFITSVVLICFFIYVSMLVPCWYHVWCHVGTMSGTMSGTMLPSSAGSLSWMVGKTVKLIRMDSRLSYLEKDHFS